MEEITITRPQYTVHVTWGDEKSTLRSTSQMLMQKLIDRGVFNADGTVKREYIPRFSGRLLLKDGTVDPEYYRLFGKEPIDNFLKKKENKK